jgi:hypothetical protein
MGVEHGGVRTHEQSRPEGHVNILEVLRGVLYPEVYNNEFEKKKVSFMKANETICHKH